MIGKLLIANRGEIACRIARTCRRLGIRSVAVFSEADRTALHVRSADEAVAIGPPPAADSYLRIDRLIEAARRSGADAVHPGYGFLAESPAFAAAVREAGLVFVGPSPEAMARLGAKDSAKALAEAAGVPVVPGYRGADQSDERLLTEARRIGFPLLIKATGGGGGKGMRRVDAPEAFAEALAACRREAQAAFGDDRVLLERAIERPRHVEVQVMADRQGRVVHLFERDCSLQRRHQKIVEEAPAPGLDPALRQALGEAAVRLVEAAGYEGAGTVEFLLASDGAFFFIEANTRLQVEHPVSEAITGQDLVEWQIRIAEGRPLPLAQEAIVARGHAIEARLYAEDPARGFLPSTGRLERLLLPHDEPGVRVDTGVAEGDRVTPFYDPMIAKIIVHAADRPAALARLERALEATTIAGPASNLAFLRRLVREPAFRRAAIDTLWLDREGSRLTAAEDAPEPLELVAAALLLAEAERERAVAAAGPWRTSPWLHLDGFRLGAASRRELRLAAAGREHKVELEGLGDALRARLDGADLGPIGMRREGQVLRLALEDRVATLRASLVNGRVLLAREGRTLVIGQARAAADAEDEVGQAGSVAAPMPGKIVRLFVEPGARVSRGQVLVVLEAMKMEHRLPAPGDGQVVAVHVAVGEQVEEGTILLDLAQPEATG